MKNTKLNYLPPTLVGEPIELEQGIAAGSASVTPGGSDGTSNPGIEELETETFTKDLIF